MKAGLTPDLVDEWGEGGSLAGVRINPDWANLPLFDRTGWTRVRFGDVVENVNETVRDPAAADVERYIGLEHLEPGSLHIRSWGNAADGTTFTRRCRPGQVLFGKRRAYQRKVAVAEFEAVVSGDIYVLEPKNERLLRELLPFVCLSERFYQFAVETSVGSLSPRTNWSHLATFEFALPPLDQQRRIAEILWATDRAARDLASAVAAASTCLESVRESELDEMFGGPCRSLANVWTRSPDSGCSAPSSCEDTGYHVLSLAALSTRGYVSGNLKPVEPTPAMVRARLSRGDFLVSRSNTPQLVGLVGIYNEKRDDVSFPDTMMRMHVDEERVSRPFLEAVLLSNRGRAQMMRFAAGTSGSMKKINRRILGQCLVPTPPLAAQQALLNRLGAIQLVVRHGDSAIAATRALTMAVTNAVLGGGG